VTQGEEVVGGGREEGGRGEAGEVARGGEGGEARHGEEGNLSGKRSGSS